MPEVVNSMEEVDAASAAASAEAAQTAAALLAAEAKASAAAAARAAVEQVEEVIEENEEELAWLKESVRQLTENQAQMGTVLGAITDRVQALPETVKAITLEALAPLLALKTPQQAAEPTAEELAAAAQRPENVQKEATPNEEQPRHRLI